MSKSIYFSNFSDVLFFLKADNICKVLSLFITLFSFISLLYSFIVLCLVICFGADNVL